MAVDVPNPADDETTSNPTEADAAYDPDGVYMPADAGRRELLYRALHRAYRSLRNVANVYRRQLDVVREQTVHDAQITDFARRLNVAEADRIGDVIMADLPRMTGARAGVLYRYDADHKLLTLFRAAPMPDPAPAPIGLADDGLIAHIVRNRHAPFLMTSRADYEMAAGRAFPRTPCEAILDGGALVCPLSIDPLGAEPILVGLLILAEKPEGFQHRDLEQAAMVCEMIAATLNTAALLQRMHILAETDGVTGLYNHRHFQQELDRYLARARRYGEPLSMALMDIDWFKRVNDTYGHQFGDQVLRAVADTIKASVRDQVDLVARYGGEEFAVIMPATPAEGAFRTAERIRMAVRALALEHEGRPVQVTISGGVSAFAPEQEKREFVDAADRALYAAKGNGRDRVEYPPRS